MQQPKPPATKYKDLPIYSSPHSDYKECLETKCTEYELKLPQRFLFPYVSKMRRELDRKARESLCDIKCSLGSAYGSFQNTKNDFKAYMRCPNNYLLRLAVLASGIAVGFRYGRGGAIRRVLFTYAGSLVAGSLCFPKETDEAFKNIVFYISKPVIKFFNCYCNKNFKFKEKIPCQVPADVDYGVKQICPKK